jgi:hypothetical protein
VAGLVAANWRGGDVAPYARVAAPAGVVHALTALYQTQLVFGAKVIMRPAYYGVSYMHLLAALATAAAPERESRLLAQYLVLCIFTWCRVYMVLLRARPTPRAARARAAACDAVCRLSLPRSLTTDDARAAAPLPRAQRR